MSQIPPPPPPIPNLTERKEKEIFVSSLEHISVDRATVVEEIYSLGKQECFINLARPGHEPASASPTDDLRDHDGLMLIISSILQPILQNGPICGLAALAMVVQAETKKHGCELDGEATARIFQEATDRGFTKRGEMFSADNMASLAHDFLRRSVQLLNTAGMTRAEIQSMVVANCLKGNYFLVPYDADRNHRPGLFRGHKAHWCVVTGFGACIRSPDLDEIHFPPENARDGVVFLEPEALIEKEQALISDAMVANTDGPRQGLCVLARQSKSKHVGMWPLEALVESNRNLLEIAPKILADSNDYVLHPITTTLKDSIILIS